MRVSRKKFEFKKKLFMLVSSKLQKFVKIVAHANIQIIISLKPLIIQKKYKRSRS